MKTISYLFAAMAAIAVVCGCKGNSGSKESEEETVEKTAVSVETLTGVWGAEGGLRPDALCQRRLRERL